MDISALSSTELKALAEKVKVELKSRERGEIENARAQILAIARNMGVPVQDLIEKRTTSPVRLKSGTVLAVQFRDPHDVTKQWNGRGRPPAWIKEWQAAGNSIDRLRV